VSDVDSEEELLHDIDASCRGQPDGLRALETPPATPTHVPVPHFRVVDLIKSTLGMYGHVVEEGHYGVTQTSLLRCR
jgi:hypothetical protein